MILCVELNLFCVYPCVQNQAEAHYKGHKHARKLKALESQRNRQKNGHGLYTAGKDRENGTTGAETLPASESHSTDRTGTNLSISEAFCHCPTISDNWCDISTQAWLLSLLWLIALYYCPDIAGSVRWVITLINPRQAANGDVLKCLKLDLHLMNGYFLCC